MEKVNIMLGMFVGVLLILSVLIIFTNIANSKDLTSLNTKEHITIIKEDTPDFLKEDFNSEYGVIEISKSDSTKLADYSLTKIDESIINVIVYGKAILYSDGKLFDDKKFKDIKNNLIELDYSQYYIYKNVSYVDQEVATYKEICSTPITEKGNITSEKEVCYSVPNTYKNVTKSKMEWIEYNYEILKSGNYEWKMEARRPINKQVDFIPVAQEKELTEWVWWNNAWNSKKEIKVKENDGVNWDNYTALIIVAYGSGMQADFDDLRFVNSAEDTELGYWIENKTNSNNANIWVNVSLSSGANTTIYMYYGNSGVSTTSSRANVWKGAVTDANGKTFSSTDADNNYADSRGFLLTTKNKIILLNYTKTSGTSCDSVALMSGTTSLKNFTNSGGTVYLLASGTNFYMFGINQGGTTCAIQYGNFGGYPLAQTNINWKNGDAWYSGAHHTDTNGFGILSITSDERATTEPTIYFGAEMANTCTFSGYVKDSAGGGLDEAEVVIFNQNNKSEIYNTTTDENGYWSKEVINSTSNFVAVAYYNNTLVGSAKPFISGTC